jgi:hypothetical protein
LLIWRTWWLQDFYCFHTKFSKDPLSKLCLELGTEHHVMKLCYVETWKHTVDLIQTLHSRANH